MKLAIARPAIPVLAVGIFLSPGIAPAAAAQAAWVWHDGPGPHPAPSATIVAYSAQNNEDRKAYVAGQTFGSGPLVIRYSDGASISIPRDACDVAIDKDCEPQQQFDDLQLSPDTQTIGWEASYMMCAQSYPCDLQLVIFHYGRKAITIFPIQGALQGWAFVQAGAQVVVTSNFEHGDAPDICSLYDTATGRHIADYDKSKNNMPIWAKGC